jgi:hypothetical protein
MNWQRNLYLAFASWKIDFLKLDGCYANITDFEKGFPAMGKALNSKGRSITYHCDWPCYQEYVGMKPNYTAVAYTCNLWRNWHDIQDSWESVYSTVQWFADNYDRLAPFHGTGH